PTQEEQDTPGRAAKRSLGMIPKPIQTPPRDTTAELKSDRLLAAITGQPLPDRPLDGVDLTGVIDGKLDARPTPIAFWDFDSGRLMATKPEPYIDPKLQEGTTPLVKLMGSKATRDFVNFRYPAINDADYLGPRSIIVGDHKLVVRENNKGEPGIELFNLKIDPAEKTNLIDKEPELALKLQDQLRQWQESVLNSLTGADYHESK
ncbi:MAG: hypothetical protein WBG04_09630, partial [Haloferula sp.]